MPSWEPTEFNIEAIKETIETLRGCKAYYPSYMDYKAAKLLEIWLDGQKAKNNPDVDNPSEK
jgi:hypothetical protein